MIKTPASSSPVWKAVNLLTTAHVQSYRLLGGRLVGGIGSVRFLLLDHVGARSGKRRTTPLNYIRDGDRYVLIASKGGTDRHPAWFHNLKAHPRTTIQAGSERIEVTARVATPDEREALWPRAVEAYGGYADYAKQAAEVGRTIPVVILDPV